MQRISIGRAPNCDIFFNDASVSKMHAEIIVNENEILVRDLGSTNGTFINGLRVYGSQPLKQYDILKVGNSLVPWRNYVTLNPSSSEIPGSSIQNKLPEIIEVKPPSVNEWMLNLFLLAIPLVGFVFLIIWANGNNKVFKNYAIAMLWWFLIILLLYGFLILFIFKAYRNT